MAPSVKHVTLGFSSGPDLMVCGFEPHSQHGACLGFSLSLSLSVPPLLSISLNKQIHLKKKRRRRRRLTPSFCPGHSPKVISSEKPTSATRAKQQPRHPLSHFLCLISYTALLLPQNYVLISRAHLLFQDVSSMSGGVLSFCPLPHPQCLN